MVCSRKIIERVWEGAFVTDEVLTNAIWELRKAFGDDAKERRFIQTVPRKGYRLLVPVHAAADAPAIPRWRVACVAVLLGLGAALASWAYLSRDRTAGPELRAVPVTGFAGAVARAFSRRGSSGLCLGRRQIARSVARIIQKVEDRAFEERR